MSVSNSGAPDVLSSPVVSSEAPAARSTIRRALGFDAHRVLLNIESPSGKHVRVDCSPVDVILDIRQFLLECPETCELTCYHIESPELGIILNDYVELADYPSLCDGLLHSLKISPEFYDERAARLHVRRVREIIENPPAQIVHTLVPALEELKEQMGGSKKKKGAVDGEASLASANFLLSSPFSLGRAFFPPPSKAVKNNKIPECVKSISFSGWNPPPGNRRLRGDLLYLDVSTLEDRSFHVTASVEGFFLNRSSGSSFDPSPAETSYKSHSLVDLLKRASPSFNSRFTSLLGRQVFQHPFQLAECPANLFVPWLADAESLKHGYDWNRSEDSLLATFGMDSRGVTRDWNEEIQACKELPKESLDERIMRDRTSYRVYTDFVDAATKGACAVVHGHIPPVNPMDPHRQQVFIYNSIFFSFAVDGRDLYTSAGGDRVSHAQAGHDLAGVAQLSRLDISGLHTVATALVDYRGHRVIAQSIIPGIFNGDRASKHVYGSMDQGKSIEAKPEFHSLVSQAAEKLHMAEHTVLSEDGKAVTIASSFEAKGIIGSDGRAYLLDLLRLQPRDGNFPDPASHPTALLRPELITMFCRKLAVEKVLPQSKAPAPGVSAESSLIEGPYMECLNNIRFNVDLLTGARLGDSEEKLKAARELINAASEFLVKDALPKLLAACGAVESAPVDSEALTTLFHQQGVNMRYLGKLAALASEARQPQVERLCVEEMIVRAAKRLLGGFLREVQPDRSQKAENWFFGPTIARFLSALLGPNCAGARLKGEELQAAALVKKMAKEPTEAPEARKGKSKKGGKKDKEAVRLADGRRAPLDALAPANLWQAIRDLIQEKFQFAMPECVVFSSRAKLILLRALCRKTGIQLVAKDFDLSPESSNASPFTVDDISDLHPVVKAAQPGSADAASSLQTGRAYLAQGRLSGAYELLQESLIAHTQVFGAMHSDTGFCYSTLAQVLYQIGEFSQAVDFQQRALITFERTLGPDHFETAHAHMNLALFLHSVGHPEAALKHVRRSLSLLELIAGPDHPDTAAAHMNLAMIYQDLGIFQPALVHLEKARSINEKTLGAAHLQVALSHHSLAVAQGLLGNYRGATEEEKKAKSVYSQALGAKHARTQQSQAWFEHLTALAVKAAGSTAKTQPLTPAKAAVAIMPPSLSLQSPLSWVSLRGALSFKGRLTMNDVLELLESAVRQEGKQEKEKEDQNNTDQQAS